MNITASGLRSIEIDVIVREHTGTLATQYLFELIKPGGKRIFIKCSLLSFTDNDSPYHFEISTPVIDKEQYQINIYYFPLGITSGVIAAYTSIENAPKGDTLVSLKQAVSPVVPELIYRGQLYVTDETNYYPYNPVSDDYEVIEKSATEFKTR